MINDNPNISSTHNGPLVRLRLPAFRRALEAQLAAPQYDELSFEERLALLLEAEVLQRQDNRIQRQVRVAHFQQTAWVQEIDYSPGRGLQRQQILQLAQTTWIRKGLNLIILGPTRAGKTYIACVLGWAACEQDLVTRYFRLPRFFLQSTLRAGDGNRPTGWHGSSIDPVSAQGRFAHSR